MMATSKFHQCYPAGTGIAPPHIQRGIIVAVAGQSPQAYILIKVITTGRIGYEPIEILLSLVVNPGQGFVLTGNYIITIIIIKMAKLHGCQLPCSRIYDAFLFFHNIQQVLMLILSIPSGYQS